MVCILRYPVVSGVRRQHSGDARRGLYYLTTTMTDIGITTTIREIVYQTSLSGPDLVVDLRALPAGCYTHDGGEASAPLTILRQ